MIDDVPKALLAFLATALALGRVWIAVDRSSRVALAFRARWTPQTWRLAWAALGLTAFIAVAEDVVFEEHDELILRLDRVMDGALTAAMVPSHPLAVVISHFTGEGLVLLVGVGVVTLLIVGRHADVLTILIGALTAWGMSGLLKLVCGVRRPRADPVVDWLSRNAFPSEHTVVAVVALGTMAWVLGRDRTRLARVGLCVVVGAVALATGAWRVMIRAYWPSDALGGLTLGAAWLAMVIVGAQWRERTGPNRKHPYRKLGRGGRRGHRRPVALEYQAVEVAETYDRRRFHSLGGRYNNWRLHRLLNRVLRRLPAGSVVLDIPCGTGRIDNWLLTRSLRVIAADISSAMLDVARRKVWPQSSGPEFLSADANHLPFRSCSVDGVLSIRFLHLMDPPDRQIVLREMARVAKQWALVEYRNVDTPVKAAKRAIILWLTGQQAPKKRMISEIADELSQCGLVAERYYFINRWFSGSVLVMTRHHREPSGRCDLL